MDVRIISLMGNAAVQGAALTLETVRGQIQVLDNHADLIASVVPGTLSVDGGKVASRYMTGTGLLRVQDGQCVVLLDRLLEDSAKGRELAQTRIEELEVLAAANASDALADELEFLRRFLAQ